MSVSPRRSRRRAGRAAGRVPGVVAIVSAVAVAAMLALPALTLAASPEPSGATGADTRSAGQGPGLVGAPGQAVLAVLVIAVVAIALTLAYVRFTAPRRPPTA